jgi:hypothetical protein
VPQFVGRAAELTELTSMLDSVSVCGRDVAFTRRCCRNTTVDY